MEDWQRMITNNIKSDQDLGVLDYMQSIFEERHKWAYFTTGGLFTVGLNSTQRNESMNSTIKKGVKNCGRGYFIDIIKAFEDTIKRNRDKVTKRQFKV